MCIHLTENLKLEVYLMMYILFSNIMNTTESSNSLSPNYEYLIADIGVDTADDGPIKVCQTIANA